MGLYPLGHHCDDFTINIESYGAKEDTNWCRHRCGVQSHRLLKTPGSLATT